MKKDRLKNELKNLIKKIKRGKVLTGKELALILKKITNRELKPGGPYLDFKLKKPDLKLNILIGEFLKTQKVVLPNLEKFINEKTSNRVKIKSHKQKTPSNQRMDLSQKKENTEIKKIFKLAKNELKNLPKEFQQEIIKVIKETAKNNPDKQMLLLPYYFYKSLDLESAQEFRQEEFKEKEKLITKLGLINTYFWSAFIIYDDFWDEDEKARPKLLPVANFMSRNLIEFYLSEFQKYKDYQKYYQELLNNSDYANFFETINGRFKNNLIKNKKLNLEEINLINYKDYKIKFFPAGAHILGPLLIMAHLGFKVKSKEVRNLENFFINYLIARQLNDDLYDFEEDLARGNLSSAVNETLIQAESQGYKQVNEDGLKKIFWLKTLKILSKEIIKKTKLAENYLKKVKMIKKPEPLLRFSDLARASALKALKERKETLDFIREIKENLNDDKISSKANC